MGPILADTTPHRAHFAWLSIALVASITLAALTRPPHHRHHHEHAQRIGHCVGRAHR